MFRRSEFRTSSLKRCVIPSCLRIRYPHEHLHYNKNPRTHRILWHNGFTALVLKLLNPDVPFIQFIVLSTSNVRMAVDRWHCLVWTTKACRSRYPKQSKSGWVETWASSRVWKGYWERILTVRKIVCSWSWSSISDLLHPCERNVFETDGHLTRLRPSSHLSALVWDIRIWRVSNSTYLKFWIAS